jgi:hypothetical protein
MTARACEYDVSTCLRYRLRCAEDGLARSGGSLFLAAACVARRSCESCYSASPQQQPQGRVWAAVIDFCVWRHLISLNTNT